LKSSYDFTKQLKIITVFNMPKVEYKYTIAYVKDVTATIEFYEKAFGFERIFVTPENDYGELNTGNTTLSFASFELGNSNFKNGFTQSSLSDKPFGVEFAFVTDDIEFAFVTAIEYGAIVLEEITTKPWGQKVAYLRDPNGILLEICTPVNH
jgi:lactoylglutathione lyase